MAPFNSGTRVDAKKSTSMRDSGPGCGGMEARARKASQEDLYGRWSTTPTLVPARAIHKKSERPRKSLCGQ
uniref:Uncharacterized protein n=1 Tax=Mycena chlorophos TaxID=658473 RepID=A0ABQ0LSQ8_MYCCL|nr:predicted protein [Mycena chlorophos]